MKGINGCHNSEFYSPKYQKVAKTTYKSQFKIMLDLKLRFNKIQCT